MKIDKKSNWRSIGENALKAFKIKGFSVCVKGSSPASSSKKIDKFEKELVDFLFAIFMGYVCKRRYSVGVINRYFLKILQK